MGSGKSTVGRALAERLSLPFLDTDDLIVERAGLSIPEIFSLFGEDFFRKLESEVLREVSLRERGVVATGGGVVVREENVEVMRKTGVVIFLDISFEAFLERMDALRDGRPLLSGSVERVRDLFFRRMPLYSRAAHFTVKVDGREVREVVEEVLRCLNLSSPGKIG